MSEQFEGARNRRIREVSEAAHVVFMHMVGDQRSVIDPSQVIWTRRVAEDVRDAIMAEESDAPKSQLDRLEAQFRGASREAILFVAEALYLRSLPIENVKPETKRGYVQRMLNLLGDAPVIPESMEPGFEAHAYHGGLPYNLTTWNQVVWLARFVIHWWEQPEQVRNRALEDPWKFREVVEGVPEDLPLMRNAFLAMVWPDEFESITSDGDKKKIRDTYAHVIGGPSGDSGEAIDRDILAIRRQLEQPGDDRIPWYSEPYWIWYKKQQSTRDGESARRAWAVRPGAGGRERINSWVSKGYTSLDGTRFPHDDEKEWTKEEVRDAVAEGYDHVDYAQRLYLTNDYFAFLRQLQRGDLLVTRDGDEVWIGEIADEYYFDTEVPRLRRNVNWVDTPVQIDELPAQARPLLTADYLVVDLTEVYDSLEALLSDVTTGTASSRDESEEEQAIAVNLLGATDELAQSLNIDREWLGSVIGLLESRRQIILYGPPGTGKTHLALSLAKHAASEESVRVVQFHPSYAYEDFFEGFRPQKLDDGSFGFTLVPGPLRRMASQAVNNPSTAYVLIIDEINRANIAKVFGELYFLLEYRDERIELQYSAEERFALPKNLFIIGTMNTADRSIAMVDAAIRRRFSFVEMHPATEPVASLLRRWLSARKVDDERAALLDALNQEIEEHDFKIGPSYLMRSEAETPEGLERIWDFDILPLLDEHYYGRLSRDQVRSRFGLAALLRKTRSSAESPAVEVSDDEDGDEAPVP